MAKVNITLGVRSSISQEVEPGVFKYPIKEYENISADTLDEGFNKNDGSTMESNTALETRLSFLMSNDSSNRLKNIVYVRFLGTIYKVTNVTILRPRVQVSLGEVWQE